MKRGGWGLTGEREEGWTAQNIQGVAASRDENGCWLVKERLGTSIGKI